MAQQLISRRSHEQLYQARAGGPEIVDVPAADFVMIDGRGDPNTSPDYASAIQALYSAAYGLKFALKKAGAGDERVAPLEGLWSGAEDVDFAAESKGDWDWTMMIRLPAAADGPLIEDALGAAARKKPELPIGRLRVERFQEGLAAQVLHVGPYAAEALTIRALHAFIADRGYRVRGRHHEIYLGDPRRAAPERLRTVVRQPVA